MQIQFVVLGGDIGVYAIARQFHQVWRTRVKCLSHSPIAALKLSKFVDVIPVVASDSSVVTKLIEIARPDAKNVLMANSDIHSQIIAEHYDELAQYYALPFPTLDTFNLVSDKASFAKLCDSVDVPTPPTVEAEVHPGWTRPHIPFPFPLVAKPASGAIYDAQDFQGKRKIYFIHDEAELNELWETLEAGGFVGTFLIQQLIPGDNTYSRSITAYVDSHGKVTVLGSARVLLEDHAPTMIGNPVAMITGANPELEDAAVRVLEAANYRGFANFDVKIDPRDGTPYFFEVNPRIGRNSFYMTAAGVNPIEAAIRDLVFHERLERATVRTTLYSLVPKNLLLRYIRDDKLREEVNALADEMVDPLFYKADRSLRRNAVIRLQKLNHYRKFKRFYPEPTDLSF